MENTRLELFWMFPYYAHLLNQCVLSWDERVKTAGVRFTSQGGLELIIAPTFFKGLSDKHRVGLMLHELLHLAMGHLVRGKNVSDKRIANIAMDMAINQYIPEKYLPPQGILPEQFNLPKERNFEFYYEQLMKNAKKVDAETLDNHDGFGDPGDKEGAESGSIPEELKKAIIEQALQKAKDSCKDPGKVPNLINELLAAMAQKNKVGWKALLRQYIGRSLSPVKESTRCKPNRRLGLFAQGSKSTYTPKVVIGIDNSGSVSNEQCALFMNEIKYILSGLYEKTELVYFDSGIAKVEKLSKSSQVKVARHASGGTDFDPPINYAILKKPDLLIMMTDGEATSGIKTRFPVLWCIAGGNKGEHLIGRKVLIEEGGQ